jgi:hypothetical protein
MKAYLADPSYSNKTKVYELNVSMKSENISVVQRRFLKHNF